MGRTKASVLPEPVGDSARTSWPASASGMTSDWTANGLVMPRRARAPVAADDTPRSANVGDGIGVLLLLCGAGDSTDPDHAGAHSKAQTSRTAAPPVGTTLAAALIRAAMHRQGVWLWRRQTPMRRCRKLLPFLAVAGALAAPAAAHATATVTEFSSGLTAS